MDEGRIGVPRGGTGGSLTEAMDERFRGYFAEGAVGAMAYLAPLGLISSLPLLDPAGQAGGEHIWRQRSRTCEHDV